MPKRVVVNVDLQLPKELVKDLQDGEIICPTCRGLGLVVSNHRYGIKGENHPDGPFPYKKQVLVPCPHCYSGVAQVCPFCGKVVPRGYIRPELHCNCEGAQKERQRVQDEKDRARWEEAEKISLEEAKSRFKMLYIEDEEFVCTEDLAEWLDDNRVDNPDYNPRVYGTTTRHLTFDAADLVNDHCERCELHDRTYDNISDQDIADLQVVLNEWSEHVEDSTKTYHPDYSVGILYPEVSCDSTS